MGTFLSGGLTTMDSVDLCERRDENKATGSTVRNHRGGIPMRMQMTNRWPFTDRTLRRQPD